MNNFDLKKVRDCFPFRNLFPTTKDYMSEAQCLTRVALDTEPIYEVTPQKAVLFTPKLQYYRLLVENEVNRHINDATKLMDEDRAGNLTLYLLKKTFEAAETLVHEASRRLEIVDPDGELWQNITSDKPRFNIPEKDKMEESVFIHCIFAELTRCWLELQDRYAYASNNTGLYDVSLFYSSCVGCMPDKEFELSNSAKYEEEAKKFKKFHPDCCFVYDCEEYFNTAIQEFTNRLHNYQLIPDEMDCKTMMNLFRGRPCRNTYQWSGLNHILTHVIKGLCDGENPAIRTWPEGTSKWDVVSARFRDKNGNPMPNIRQEKLRTKQKAMIKDIVDSLTSYI